MAIAKVVFGVAALVFFGLKTFNIPLGTMDVQAAGLFCLAVAVLPI